MSQSPISYESPMIYPPSPPKPTTLTVLAVLGIVFGGLGVLCLGFTDVFSAFALASPAMSRFARGQTLGERVIGLMMGLCGLALCGILLWGSIGSLNLRPGARRLLVSWAVADIIFDLVRLVAALAILVPATSQNPAFQQNPAFRNNANTQQIVAVAKVGGVIGAIATWVISTTFAALILICFRKPEIVAAFEKKPPDPNAKPSLPIPPM